MHQEEIKKLLKQYAEKYPPLITITQASEIASLPIGTLYDWSSQNLLDHFKFKRGRRVRLGRDAFIQFLVTRDAIADTT